ncbi:MAG: hypothetical protein ABIT08_08695 [Bacteroidia bacterium]
MKKNSIILKSVSYLILVVLLYMHVCSALCATTGNGLCGKKDKGRSCCHHEKKSNSKERDCQDMHFAFFNTTGQFSQVQADISFKAFQSLVAVITPLFIFKPDSEIKMLFVYNRFHPPPPKADIRIFISSFQI